MKKLLKIIGAFFILCYCLPITVHAQDDSLFRLLRQIEYPLSQFAVDNLGELYIINIDNQLKKYNENGDSIGVYNQVTKYGQLTYVEAQNPFKTLLFYKGFSTIVLLDKYLKVMGSINLRNKNIFMVKAITTSYDNNIWLYDEQDNKIKKIDDAGNLLSESTDFRRLFDTVPVPQKLIDHDGFLYLYDPERGMYVFDYYGSFQKHLPFYNWRYFTLIDKNLYGFDDACIYEYRSPSPLPIIKNLPQAFLGNTSMKVANHKLYILKNQLLTIYSLQ